MTTATACTQHALGRILIVASMLVCVGPLTVSATALASTPAPKITVTGQALTWNSVNATNQYVFVAKVPGKADAYSVIQGTSITPVPVPGATVRYSVRANVTDSLWATEVSVTYSTSSSAPPANTAPPRIGGTLQQGQTLTALPGSWTGSPAPTLTYAWSDGESGPTDLLGAVDVGQKVAVAVTAANSRGSVTATSASVGPVLAGASSGPTLSLSGTSISWAAIAGATAYEVATSTGPRSDSSRTTTYAAGLSTNTSWTPAADPGKTEYYGVESLTPSGNSWSSTEVSITWPASTSKLRVSVMNTTGWGVDSYFKNIGVTWERLDVGDGTDVSQVTSAVRNGMKVLVLYSGTTGTLGGVSASTAAAQTVALAKRIAPLGLTEIEFGNEVYANENVTAYAAQYDAAHQAVAGTGVKLIAVGTAINAYNATASWIPTFISDMSGGAGEVDGWTIHPYGPMVGGGVNAFDWQTVNYWHTIAVNAGSTAPWYITEVGQCISDGSACTTAVPQGNASDAPGTGTAPYFNQAADMTQYLTDTVNLYPWVTYFDWYTGCGDSSGDFGLINMTSTGCNGTGRPAYYALANWMAAHASSANG